MLDHGPLPHEHQPHVNPSPSLSNVESTPLSSSSPVENSNFSKWMGKKKTKRKAKNKNTKRNVIAPTYDLHVGIPPATDHDAGSIDVPISGSCKPKFPCRICKGDHLIKDCPSISLVLEVWSKHPLSSVSNHHVDDAPSTSDSLVKSQKGKVRYPFFLCKDMHRTYLCPHMDEATKLLEELTVA